MCHRLPSLRWYADKWDFPGGHIEDGETAGDALVRELREEVAVVSVRPGIIPTSSSVKTKTHRTESSFTDGSSRNGQATQPISHEMSTMRSSGSHSAMPLNSTWPTMLTPGCCVASRLEC